LYIKERERLTTTDTQKAYGKAGTILGMGREENVYGGELNPNADLGRRNFLEGGKGTVMGDASAST